MKSYVKIEIFAYDLFHSVWFKGGLISRKYDATEIYKDEILTDDDFEEVCDKLFYDAVLCRRILFQKIYMQEIADEKEKYWDSISDFYEYIHRFCNRYDCFGYLSVFERILATCAFVINLCFYNIENENLDIINSAHVLWATYFEEFSEEFYQQGGWNQLKSVTNSYTLPLMFLQICLQDPEYALLEVTEALENYSTLKKISIIDECKTVSKLWIRSRIRNLHTTSCNPVGFAGYEDFFHAEYILNELKRLCNPFSSEVLQYDEECSERTVFDSDSFYLPLTPTESQESTPERNSFSDSSDGTGVIPERFYTPKQDFKEIISEFKIDFNYFVNKLNLSELDDSISSSSSLDDESCGCLHIYEQPIEFESISIISDSEQDPHLSRSMSKLHLNHETLELEEKPISETDICDNTNNNYSVDEDSDINTKSPILAHQTVTDKQHPMFEDSSNTVGLVRTDSELNMSVTEGNTRHNEGLKECQFMIQRMFLNSADSCDKISISEWNEKDLVKNVSTPLKQKKS